MTDRPSLEARIRAEGLAPMWTRPKMLARPDSVCVPRAWRYEAARELLLESAPLVSPQDAERRVLILENPGLAGRWILSPTLFAGLQLLMPGEVAPPHRHSQAALRFVLEGAGAFATVGDERIPLEQGDLVVNPRWDWHAHDHEGNAPVLWLDVLDVPLVRTFEADFREWSSTPIQTQTAGRSVKHFPYAASRPRPGDSFTYPTGLPTITARLDCLRNKTPVYRSTETLLLLIVEGGATLTAGEHRFPLGRHDLAFVPPWTTYSLQSEGEAVVFSASNREALERLELWREEFL